MRVNAKLLKDTQTIYATNLNGLSMITDSQGHNVNAHFSTHVQIDTTNNFTIVTYIVGLFNQDSPDYFREEFSDYDKAKDKYNELVTKYNAYKIK